MTCFIFFFQAEDGIRDRNVTGVQTCALPICEGPTAIQEPMPTKVADDLTGSIDGESAGALAAYRVSSGVIDGGEYVLHGGNGCTERYAGKRQRRSEEHTSELQSRFDLVCRLL